MPADMWWFTPADHWCMPFPASQRMFSLSRVHVEHEIRRRVLAHGRVQLIPGQEARGLLIDGDDVRGVSLRSRNGEFDVDLAADLVLDASGRGSHLPDWLEAADRSRPAETVVDSFLGYASQDFRIPADWAAEWQGLFLMAAPPRRSRGGLLFPIGDGRWTATVVGGGGDYPPTDQDGFLDFVRSLPSPVLYDAISAAEPLGPVRGYRRTANQRRHYERLRDLPAGVLAVGDSLCAFNPVYGQGMSVAALQAVALAEALGRVDGPATVRSLRDVQRTLAKRADQAWLMATGEDLRYPTTVGARATMQTRLSHRYMDRVLATLHADPVVNAAFLRVLNLLDPPTAMFRPAVLRRVLVGPGRRTTWEGPVHTSIPPTAPAAAVIESAA